MSDDDEPKEEHKQETYEEVDDSHMVTVSERLLYHKKRGKYLTKRAQEILVEGTQGKASNAIAAFLKHDDAASMFYKGHVSYKASGRFREAADSLILCAKMYEHQKMFLEAGTLYTEASDLYNKVDKGECVRTLRKAISIYCDAGKFEISARMERKVADMHFESKHWEEAAFHYRKAANFLAGEQLLDQSDLCLMKASTCFAELGELEKVKELEEMCAYGSVQSNLRRFNARGHIMSAVMTLLAKPINYQYGNVTEKILRHGMQDFKHVEPEDVIKEATVGKYDVISIAINEYDNLDYMWKPCKEKQFLQNVVKFRLEWDLHNLVDHIYYWNNVRPLSRFHLRYLKCVVDEITTEEARKKELRDVADLRKEKEVQRRARKQELREQSITLGLSLDAVLEAMEQMIEEDEAAVQAAKTPLTLIWEAHFTGETKKDIKKRVAAEHAAEVGGEEGGEGEGEEGDGEEGEGGGGGDEEEEHGDDHDAEMAFDDAFVDEDEETEEKEEKKERRRRVKK